MKLNALGLIVLTLAGCATDHELRHPNTRPVQMPPSMRIDCAEVNGQTYCGRVSPGPTASPPPRSITDVQGPPAPQAIFDRPDMPSNPQPGFWSRAWKRWNTKDNWLTLAGLSAVVGYIAVITRGPHCTGTCNKDTSIPSTPTGEPLTCPAGQIPVWNDSYNYTTGKPAGFSCAYPKNGFALSFGRRF